jgi:GNAT superfamily N-acetyltransferase
LRSKASWGYSDEFMARVRTDMTVTAMDIERDRVDILESEERLLGYSRLRSGPAHAELIDLFIDPEAMATGHGRRLFEHALEVARGWGAAVVELDSDPHAEAFYLSLGTTRVRETRSTLSEGRSLPRLRYSLSRGR